MRRAPCASFAEYFTVWAQVVAGCCSDAGVAECRLTTATSTPAPNAVDASYGAGSVSAHTAGSAICTMWRSDERPGRDSTSDESATVSWPDFTESKYRESRQHRWCDGSTRFLIYDYLVPVHPLQAALDPDFAGVEVQILPFQPRASSVRNPEAYAADQPCLEPHARGNLQQLAYLADIQNLRFINRSVSVA